MKEIEAKILEVNRPKIEKTLTSLGAKKIFDGDIQTFFFDSKEHTIIKSKDVLRLRKEQNKTELTYKKVHFTETSKDAEEYSVEISDFYTMKTILENIGLFVIESMEKHRVSYVLDQARFDIDCYYGDFAYIPEFLEIEAENSDSIHKYAGFLGFKPEDCLPWSTQDIIQYYSSKKEKKLS
ncbi:MAG TPA: CYTH domain-containing protein [Candidatus Acidoferrum sp.]|nr:CYTH domain-containing protein [Candidatus Acidoferrum sp.]